MDGESGLLRDVISRGLELVDESEGIFQFTGLPITDSAGESHSFDSIFERRVTIRAIRVRLLSSPVSTPAGSAEEPTPLTLTFALKIKKPGDEEFASLRETGSSEEKVRSNSELAKNARGKSSGPESKTCPFCVSIHLYSDRTCSLIQIQTFTVTLPDQLPRMVQLQTEDESLQDIVQLRTEFRTVTGPETARVEFQLFGCSEGELSLHFFHSQQGQR